ncbi:MAG: hypothetical protein K8S27_03750 [Candidatus Omnitrophica bacterium]|nr:hypothetical protein [Candidatus Omnitrophota bacterium]
MQRISLFLAVLFALTSAGCETVYEGSKKGGEYIGKGTRAVGGVTEGAADGYVGKETAEENPYGR